MKFDDQRLTLMALHKIWKAFEEPDCGGSIESYYESLAHIPPDLLHAAVDYLILNAEEHPAIATILNTVNSDPNGPPRGEGWETLCDRIRAAKFSDGPEDLPDTVRAAIAACGGWNRISTPQWTAFNKDVFIKAFEAEREREERRSLHSTHVMYRKVMPKQLKETMNDVWGYEVSEVISANVAYTRAGLRAIWEERGYDGECPI